MTVMTWGNSEGTKGRCDARCHNARGAECHCMCGGLYHGSGRNGTFERVREQHREGILAAAEARAKADGYVVTESKSFGKWFKQQVQQGRLPS